MRPSGSTIGIAVLAMTLAACSGGKGYGPTDPGGVGSTRTIKPDPSFNDDVYEIFTRRGCTNSSCHGGGAGGLTMSSAATAYANLVDKAAVGKTGETRVIPGDAVNSYLVKKLEGAVGIAGVQMPNGGEPLDNIDLTNIKNWINKGAKDN